MRKVLSQNKRGIKSVNRLEELYYVMSTRNILAVCLQETWRHGNEILENGHYRLITSGLSRNVLNGSRGSQSVVIVLSQEGVIAWKAAGSELHNGFGARIIAIRLLLKDIHNKDVSVFLVST